MKVLVINAGSSSMKYQFFNMADESVIAKGNCERIGIDGLITHWGNGEEVVSNDPVANHSDAFKAVVKMLTSGAGKVIDDVSEITAVGHRVVHGGEHFSSSVIIDEKVLEGIRACVALAPLHNPANITGIEACMEVMGKDVPQVAVFDTAFHQTMPREAYMFGIPYDYYEKYGIRRYGFHGTSHRYVTGRYGAIKGGLDGTKIITCHLGNGSSIAAVKDGKVVDTTMGFTPLDGFIMGTRSGGIDPSVVTYLMEQEGMSPAEMNDLLNKKSGFIGLSGVSSDCRDVRTAANSGNDRARMTLDVVTYQIRKFIGSYMAAMDGADAVIFTGGIGENDHFFRQEVCEKLSGIGVEFSATLNEEASREEKPFTVPGCKVEAWVIPTNEEVMIARDTIGLVEE